jgi:hypothetical protein
MRYHLLGAKIIRIEYALGNPRDTLAEAGNYDDEAQFVSGTVLNSTEDIKIKINNRYLGTILIGVVGPPACGCEAQRITRSA